MISIEPKSIIRENKVSFSSTINPDQLHTGNLEFQINKGRDRIAQTVEKISNQVKKPVKKITWELFTA